MTMTFWLLAALMSAAAVALVLLPLLRRNRAPEIDAAAVDADLYRRRRQELETEYAAGQLDDAALERARLELERALLHDLEDAPAAPAPQRRRSWSTALVVLLALPAAAVALYVTVGRTDLLRTPSTEALLQGTPDQFPLAIDRLAQRLREHPEETVGWHLLGRSYFALGRLDDALEAYRRGLATAGDDADLLVDYAEALAVAADQDLQGQPRRLLARALAVEPAHGKGLWLAGIAAHDAGDFRQAIDYWTRLRPMLPDDSEEAVLVNRNIAQAQARLEQSVQAEATGVGRVAVRVQLAPELAERAPADARVFVFARAPDGPPMPIAVRTLTVGELPATVVLDESASMTSGAPLSSYSEVNVTARVSRSGQAAAAAGDLEGAAGPVAVGDDSTADIVIDRVVP